MQQKWQVIHGDALDVLTKHELGTFDASFSDPPYGISFMGRGWDRGVPSPDVWRAVMAACRPGANVVAFGGTRTWHRLAVAMEDSGLEMRDSIISWMYGSGWPKPADVSKHLDKLLGAERVVIGKNRNGREQRAGRKAQSTGTETAGMDITAPATPEAERFSGYHANLKPAWEPALMFRVPMPGSLARNALDHGVAGLNVDGARIGEGKRVQGSLSDTRGAVYGVPSPGQMDQSRTGNNPNIGRWPANVVLCCPCEGPHEPGCPVYELDEQSGYLQSGKAPAGGLVRRSEGATCYGKHTINGIPGTLHGDGGGASRFFYVAKVSAAERGSCAHPCMKPIDLCRHIATLLLPPPRADGQPRRLLVPFSGSGSEMIGALQAGWDEVVGIELDPDCEGWVDFSLARIAREMLSWRECRGEIKAENAPEIRGVQLGLFAG